MLNNSHSHAAALKLSTRLSATTSSWRGLLLVSLLLGLLSCSRETPVPTAGSDIPVSLTPQIRLRTVSTQSWLVTGGDVLVEVELSGEPGEQSGSTVPRVFVNGDDVSTEFVQLSSTRWQGMVRDLNDGSNMLTATLPNSDTSARLEISNYPISGPIISGPHESPYYCQTDEFELVAGGTLGPALDGDCLVDTRIDYVYFSAAADGFAPYPPEDDADITVITDDSGDEVPYVVRVETGVVNRAVYEVAMLHRPEDGPVTPFSRSPAWNGNLVYTHGGGCRSGWYQQGSSTGGVMRDGLLRMGYALVSASLNVFGQNCNDLLASETHIMVKERFIEHYGEPFYTIATGASGGSYQSHQTADNYPGVFDGIIVAASFPDVTSATIFTLADARLLHFYFDAVNPDGFDRGEQQAVAGFGSWGSIANLARGAARLDPIFDPEASAEEQGGEVSLAALEDRRYSPQNLNGVRATVYDHTVNVYGQFDGTRIARRPLDNVGVQYGLGALNNALITPRQFIDLNRDIGGFDYDMNHVPERHMADGQARKLAIESGRILSGGGGLAATPIIDYRSYTDDREDGDIHMIVHQFSTRQRLIEANGHAGNHVMLVGGDWGFTEDEPDLAELFRQMDRWLTAIKTDSTDLEAAEKVLRNRPASLVDACWDNRDGGHERIEEEQTFIGDSLCNELYPAYPTPRHVAGAPLANAIVSCRLRPLSESDYAVSFTEEQWQELQTVFAAGVCDWSYGDVSAAAHQGGWISFGPSPVNRLSDHAAR